MEKQDNHKQYKTKQRDILLSYLERAPRVHFTAGDVYEYFHSQGSSIGQSTIYRQLESLVDEGIVNKYMIDPNSPACFEYLGCECSKEPDTCYHCKCEVCGKLIHLHCEEMNEMSGHLLKEHGFIMDPKRTVFYGLCEDCGKKA